MELLKLNPTNPRECEGRMLWKCGMCLLKCSVKTKITDSNPSESTQPSPTGRYVDGRFIPEGFEAAAVDGRVKIVKKIK